MDGESLARDRLGLEVLPVDECWDLVAASPVGRVAFLDAGEPLILPVTHGLHGHQVVFRTASGTKLSAAEVDTPVAFEVDGWDAEAQSGWSVVVRGTASTVYDDEEIAELERTAGVPWLDAARAGTWVRILATEITGRKIPD